MSTRALDQSNIQVKTKSKAKWFWLVLVLFGLAGIFAFPIPSTSTDGVHPSLAYLPKPFRKVTTEYYLDGGSIGVLIVDANGTINKFALPVSGSPKEHLYTNFVPGTMWLPRTNPQPTLPLDSKTKRYFVNLIETHSVKNGDAYCALIYLRGAPRDYIPLGKQFLKNVLLPKSR